MTAGDRPLRLAGPQIDGHFLEVLGASPARVRRDVLGRAALVATTGAAVGLGGAILTSRLVRSLLFEVSPTDPLALAGACVTLLVVALIAAFLPAFHASRIDPARALRAD